MNISQYLPSLSQKQILKLEKLADIFLEWNKKLNLSSIRKREEVIIKHILDSLLILPFGFIKSGNNVLDMGTGGGFPGLPLAISMPNVKFTLVDSTTKKIAVVENIIEQIDLKNVHCLVGRSEKLGHKVQLREQFDIVTARALAGFPTMLEYCMPFVKIGGKCIAYQGPKMYKYWKQYDIIAKKLGSHVLELKKASLPEDHGYRSFIIIEKISELSKNFPRKVGVPNKKPLA